MKLAGSDISDFKLTGSQVNKIYLGINPVWPLGSATPFTDDLIAATGLADPTIIDAYQTLETTFTAQGKLTYGGVSKFILMHAITGDANQRSYNFINPSAFQLLYSTPWTHFANGMQSNGSQFADTQFRQSDHLVLGNGSIGIYFQNNLSNGSMQGVWQNASLNFGMFPRFGGQFYPYMNNQNNDVPIVNPTSQGLHQISRVDTSNILRKLRSDPVSPVANTALSLSTASFYLGGANNGSGLAFPDTRIISFLYIGFGFTPTEMDENEAAIQTFHASLGRAV